MSGRTRLQIADEVAVITVDNPPMNALTPQVRSGLIECLEQAESDDRVRGIVIAGEGRSFPAGIDISELSNGTQTPWLGEVCRRVELCSKPVVAAIWGAALGGGIELALAAHARVVKQNARLGLPDIAMGLGPGAGASQRAPRLIGARVAIDMLLSGRALQIGSPEALAFADRVVPLDVVDVASGLALELAETGSWNPTAEIRDGFSDPVAYQDVIDERRAALGDGELNDVMRDILECIEAAQLLPIDAGLALEKALFDEQLQSDLSASLRHVYAAERKCAQFPELAQRQVNRLSDLALLGVGEGTAELAISALDGGMGVTIIAADQERLDAVSDRIERVYGAAEKRGRIAPGRKAALMARLSVTRDANAAAMAPVMIDVAPETSEFCLAVAQRMPPGILVVKAHENAYPGWPRATPVRFHGPAHIMRSAEIHASPKETADDVAMAFSLVKAMHKIPIRVAAQTGEPGARLMGALLAAGERMIAAGVLPYQVDDALTAFGFSKGVFARADAIGLPNALSEMSLVCDANGSMTESLLQAGVSGRARGRGFYKYDRHKGQITPDRDILERVARWRDGQEVAQQMLTGEERAELALAAIVNEGISILSDRAVARASDLDVIMVRGFGFPRSRGGPMHAADHIGLPTIRGILRHADSLDPGHFTPHPLMDDLIKNGLHLADLPLAKENAQDHHHQADH